MTHRCLPWEIPFLLIHLTKYLFQKHRKSVNERFIIVNLNRQFIISLP